mgnify:CR=1 FL=1
MICGVVQVVAFFCRFLNFQLLATGDLGDYLHLNNSSIPDRKSVV